MKPTKQSIDTFLAGKRFAVAGVSRDPKKFGYLAFKELKEKGFDVYPVNPQADMILDQQCYHSLDDLPGDLKTLLVLTPKSQTTEVVKTAIGRGINNIWIQQKADTPEAIALAKESQVNLVTNTCILMHTEPVKGVHKFHRTLMKILRMLPS